jgi:hypothetical protein
MINSDDFSATLASKNGYVAAGAIIFLESCRQDATALSLPIICTNARISPTSFQYMRKRKLAPFPKWEGA